MKEKMEAEQEVRELRAKSRGSNRRPQPDHTKEIGDLRRTLESSARRRNTNLSHLEGERQQRERRDVADGELREQWGIMEVDSWVQKLWEILDGEVGTSG